jgi:hypothetical protein
MDNIGTIGRFIGFSFGSFFSRLECKRPTIKRMKKRTRRIHVNRKTHKEKSKIQIRKRKRKGKEKGTLASAAAATVEEND